MTVKELIETLQKIPNYEEKEIYGIAPMGIYACDESWCRYRPIEHIDIDKYDDVLIH